MSMDLDDFSVLSAALGENAVLAQKLQESDGMLAEARTQLRRHLTGLVKDQFWESKVSKALEQEMQVAFLSHLDKKVVETVEFMHAKQTTKLLAEQRAEFDRLFQGQEQELAVKFNLLVVKITEDYHEKLAEVQEQLDHSHMHRTCERQAAYIGELTEKITTQQMQSALLRTELTALRNDTNLQRGRQLEKELSLNEMQIQDLREALRSVHMEVDVMQDIINSYFARFMAAEEKLAAAELMLDDQASAEASNFSRMQKDLKEKIRQQKARIAMVCSERDRHERVGNEQRKKAEATESKLRKEVEELNEKISRLEKENYKLKYTGDGGAGAEKVRRKSSTKSNNSSRGSSRRASVQDEQEEGGAKTSDARKRAKLRKSLLGRNEEGEGGEAGLLSAEEEVVLSAVDHDITGEYGDLENPELKDSLGAELLEIRLFGAEALTEGDKEEREKREKEHRRAKSLHLERVVLAHELDDYDRHQSLSKLFTRERGSRDGDHLHSPMRSQLSISRDLSRKGSRMHSRNSSFLNLSAERAKKLSSDNSMSNSAENSNRASPTFESQVDATGEAATYPPGSMRKQRRDKRAASLAVPMQGGRRGSNASQSGGVSNLGEHKPTNRPRSTNRKARNMSIIHFDNHLSGPQILTKGSYTDDETVSEHGLSAASSISSIAPPLEVTAVNGEGLAPMSGRRPTRAMKRGSIAPLRGRGQPFKADMRMSISGNTPRRPSHAPPAQLPPMQAHTDVVQSARPQRKRSVMAKKRPVRKVSVIERSRPEPEVMGFTSAWKEYNNETNIAKTVQQMHRNSGIADISDKEENASAPAHTPIRSRRNSDADRLSDAIAAATEIDPRLLEPHMRKVGERKVRPVAVPVLAVSKENDLIKSQGFVRKKRTSMSVQSRKLNPTKPNPLPKNFKFRASKIITPKIEE